METTDLTGKDAVDLLCEIVETCIHLILFKRSLYPPDVFSRRKRFGVTLPIAKHPQLTSYIYEMVLAIKPELEKKTVDEVHVLVLSSEQIPIERFRFRLAALEVAEESSPESQLVQIQGLLRSLSVCDALLAPTPPRSTFTMVMDLTHGRPVQHDNVDSPWALNEAEEVDISLENLITEDGDPSSATLDIPMLPSELHPEVTRCRSPMAGSTLYKASATLNSWQIDLSIEESIFKAKLPPSSE